MTVARVQFPGIHFDTTTKHVKSYFETIMACVDEHPNCHYFGLKFEESLYWVNADADRPLEINQEIEDWWKAYQIPADVILFGVEAPDFRATHTLETIERIRDEFCDDMRRFPQHPLMIEFGKGWVQVKPLKYDEYMTKEKGALN